MALVVRDDKGAAQAPTAPRITARGASILPGPSQPPLHVVLVVPDPAAREVTVRAESDRASVEKRFAIGPPSARVELALEPATPVKGRDRDAVLRVRLLTPAGEADPSSPPPVLAANVGKIEALERKGPGEYTARYVLPETRYPEVAIVVAMAPWPHPASVHGALGELRVPLATAIDLPGRTEANATMSLEIAEESFGPVKAGSDGRFKLPVVVPPGYRYAKGTAVDAAGNRRTSRVDLQLPPTDQLACVLNPQRLPSDGAARARLICAASDPYGKPADKARVAVSASAGSLKGPTQLEPGLFEWMYTAPREASAPVKLVATWKQAGPSSREELFVEIVQGPAEKIELSVEEGVAHLGGAIELDAKVADAFSRPRPNVAVGAEVPFGEVSVTPSDEEGRTKLIWTLPAQGSLGTTAVTARAHGPTGSAPARLVAFVSDGALHVGVLDLAGLPLPNERVRVNGNALVTGADGTVRVGPLAVGTYEVVDAVWPGLAQTVHVLDTRGLIFPVGRYPGSPRVSQEVKVGPPLPVNVRLRVDGAVVTYWVERPDGTVLGDREVAIRVSEGRRIDLPARGDRRAFRVETKKATVVTIADVLTGVTAIAEVAP